MERNRPAYETFSWSLWNERSSLQIDGLSFETTWMFIATLPRSDYAYWSIWHNGLTRWQKLNDFEETSYFVSEMMKRAAQYPTIPGEEERKLAAEESAIHEFELEDQHAGIAIDKTQFNDNRVHRRFGLQIPVEIDIDGVPFHTQTVDISMGGMRVTDALPSTFSDTFEAVLKTGEESALILNCIVLKRTNAPLDRIRFLLDPPTEAALRTWLLSAPEPD